MFGMGRKMSNEEKEKMYKEELYKLDKEEKLYRIRDKVNQKRSSVKALKTKPARDKFNKILKGLKSAKSSLGSNKPNSVFGTSTPNSAFSGGVFEIKPKTQTKPVTKKYKEVYYK